MKYDLTVLLKADVTAEAKEKFLAKIEQTLKALEGRVVKTAEMGRKQMVYKIKGASEALYIGWTLECPGKNVVQLEKKLAVDREIIRHLLIKSVETKPTKSVKKEKK